MRRIMLGLLGAMVGTALLVGLKAQGSATGGAVAVTGPQDPAGDSGRPRPPGGPAPGGQPGSGGPASTGAPGSATGPAGATGTSTATRPPTTGTTTTTKPPSTTSASRTITGTAVAARTAKTPNCGDCSGN